MALTATATQGFEFVRHVEANEILWLPGDPGVTYNTGDLVYLSATAGSDGLVIKVGDSTATPIGRVHKTVVCPANTQAFPLPPAFFDDGGAQARTLIPVQSFVPAGTPVFKCTFANHVDDTVISYSSSSLYIAATTGNGADDRPNGALVYVYEGPGAGELNVVDDYDHTGGAVELLVQTHRPFNATLTSSSKYIVLSGEAAGQRGISLMGRCDSKDHNELDSADGQNDGDFVVYGSWHTIAAHLKNLTLPVILKQALYNT